LEPLNAAFGHVVRKLRKEIGISQEDFADRANLHRTYVSQLERGLKSPSLKAVKFVDSKQSRLRLLRMSDQVQWTRIGEKKLAQIESSLMLHVFSIDQR
jgi:predicted transcriptional regulator